MPSAPGKLLDRVRDAIRRRHRVQHTTVKPLHSEAPAALSSDDLSLDSRRKDKEPRVRSRFFVCRVSCDSGGSDGIRTRDLSLDRAAC